MICRICGDDINEKGQDNISPISGYPICEDCKDDIMCDHCYESNFGGNLYYIAEFDKILCKDCLIREADEQNYIHTAKMYYTEDWNEICSDCDTEPVIEHLKKDRDLGIQEIQGE